MGTDIHIAFEKPAQKQEFCGSCDLRMPELLDLLENYYVPGEGIPEGASDGLIQYMKHRPMSDAPQHIGVWDASDILDLIAKNEPVIAAKIKEQIGNAETVTVTWWRD